jgi:hypothetical protein
MRNKRVSLLPCLHSAPDALDLVAKLTAFSPSARPTASAVCDHPLLWHPKKRLAFLVDMSDRLELETPASPLLVAVEAHAETVVGGRSARRGGNGSYDHDGGSGDGSSGWDGRLDSELLGDASKWRK